MLSTTHCRRAIMKGYAELEIVFQRNSLDEFQASFRQRFDESENITPFIPLALNIHDPTFYSGNPQRMGQLLSESLFMPPALRDAFTSARAFSDHQQSTLKIRLLIDSNASILHSLLRKRWLIPPIQPHIYCAAISAFFALSGGPNLPPPDVAP